MKLLAVKMGRRKIRMNEAKSYSGIKCAWKGRSQRACGTSYAIESLKDYYYLYSFVFIPSSSVLLLLCHALMVPVIAIVQNSYSIVLARISDLVS